MRRLYSLVSHLFSAIYDRHNFPLPVSHFSFALVLGIFLFGFGNLSAQNGVTISSTASNPTKENPIPVSFQFDQPVNLFEKNDVEVINGSITDFYVNTPEFSYIDGFLLRDISVNAWDVFLGSAQRKIDNVVISIDINSKGEVFILTFGNGIKKYDLNGNETAFVDGSHFEGPLDLAINSRDEIYVADNEARKVFVFSETGTPLPSRTLGSGYVGGGRNEFYGPMGLDFDREDNLFIADSYNGNDTSNFERYSVKVFYSNGDYLRFLGDSGKNFNNPYRLTSDKNGRLYVSDMGGGNGRVLIFDQDLTFLDEIQGPADPIGSPGSIAVDDYGFIYVADFGENINITQLLNASDDPGQLMNLINPIKAGIQNEEFVVQVFDSERNYRGFIVNELDLPVDLALDECGMLFVNNATLSGSLATSVKLKFDLEYYNRLPDNFTANLEIEKECQTAFLKVPEGVAHNVACEEYKATGEFSAIWDETPPLIESCFEESVLREKSGFVLPKYFNKSGFTATDNCGGNLTYEQVPPAQTVITEDTTIKINVIDEAGNKSEACEFLVMIEDQNAPPEFQNCSSDVPDRVTEEEKCGAVVSYTKPTASDEDGPVTVQLISDYASGDVFPVGTTTVTFEATNAAGTTTCSFEVTVTDDEPPAIAECPEDIVVEIPADQSSATVDFTVPTAIDNCSVVSIEQTAGGASGSSFPVGTHRIEYTATDASGLVSTCEFNVIVNRNDSPEFDFCPANILVNNDRGQCGAAVSFETPTASDDDGSVTVTRTDDGPASGEAFPVGTTRVVFEADDGTNDPVICSFDIVVSDTEAPVMSNCSGDIVVEIPADQNSATVDFTTPTATDNCSVVSIEQTAGEASGSAFPVGTHRIEYTATDASGLVTTCGFNIIVNRNESPEFDSCPADILISNDPGQCSAVVKFEIPTASDDQDNVTVNRTDDGPASGEQFPIGTTTVVFEANDATNDPVICSFDVVVSDNEAPAIIGCPGDIIVEIAADETSAIVDFTAPTATNNCTVVSINRTAGEASGSSFPVGTHRIEYTATDASGLVSTCAFNIIVNKNESPKFDSCPADILISNDPGQCGAAVSFEIPTASDDEGNVVVTRTDDGPDSGEQFPIGTTTVVFEASDGFNDPVICSFDVVVSDNEAPKVSNCPGDIRLSVAYGETGREVEYDGPGFYDNCTVTTINSIEGGASGEFFDVGETVVTYQAVDASGNTATCSFTVTISENEDSELPEMTCPEDISQNSDPGTCSAVVNYEVPAVTDNSGEVITPVLISGLAPGETFPVGDTRVTYSATDQAGNRVECSFSVTVIDEEAPEIDCPNPLTASFSPEEGYAVPNFLQQIEASDNCTSLGELRLSQSPAPGTLLFESQQISITAEDAYGNVKTCKATLTLTEDISTPPEQKCRDVVVLLGANGEVTLTASQFYDGDAQEDGVTLELDRNVLSCTDTGGAELLLTITNENGISSTCTVNALVEDHQKPVLDCPENITDSFEVTEGFEVWDFSEFFPARDNCAEGLRYAQDPPIGSIITEGGDHPVTFTATDAFGNSETCTFVLELTALDSFDLLCTGEIRLPANENCEFILPDLSEHINSYPEVAEVSQSIPTGESLNEDTDVVITAQYGGETKSCTIGVNLVDYISPELSCLPIQNVPYTPAEGFTLPDYTEQIAATDNCGIVTISQSPPAGTLIRADETVQITAEDTFGNLQDCFVYVVLQDDEEEELLEMECPRDRQVDLDMDCQFEVPDFRNEVVISNPDAVITQSPEPGEFIDRSVSVSLTATLNGKSVSCSFSVELQDVSQPTIICPEDLTEIYDPTAGFTLPDYTGMAVVWDNCGMSEVVQDPAPGTVIEEETNITLTATDLSGNSSECTFLVRLSEGEVLQLTCPGDREAELGEDCQFIVPDYRASAILNNEEAVVIQAPQPGTIISESTKISLSATFEEATATCDFELYLLDRSIPTANCVDSFSIQLNARGTASISPEDIDGGSTDNCGIVSKSLSRQDFTAADLGQQQVILTVADAAGNTASCEATVTVEAFDETEQEMECPRPATLALDENGELEVSVYYDGNAEVDFELSRDYFTCADIGTHTLIVNYSGDFNGTCTSEITVVDNLPPQVTCVSGYSIELNSQGMANLSAEQLAVRATDNCGVASMSLSQSFFTTADIGEQEVTISVTDSSGNVSTCVATILVEPFEETEPDFQCVESVNLQLNERGEASLSVRDLYTGDADGMSFDLDRNQFTCQDIGEQTVTLTYSGRETGSCPISVTIEDNIRPLAICRSQTVRLDETGTAVISAEDINNGSSDNCGIASMTLSRTTFTTAEIGEQEVTLTVTDASGNQDSCVAMITVEPHESPEPEFRCVESLVLELDANGRARIHPRQLFTGNYETIQYSVTQENFTCADLGEQRVTLSYTKSDGEGSCEITIFVTDPNNSCVVGPVEPLPPGEDSYVIIYPNPGKGIVQVSSSGDIDLLRARVFDMRGRFLMAKEFVRAENGTVDRSIDLRKYQSGVYTIIYYSETREYIRRAIISLY